MNEILVVILNSFMLLCCHTLKITAASVVSQQPVLFHSKETLKQSKRSPTQPPCDRKHMTAGVRDVNLLKEHIGMLQQQKRF